MPAHAFARAQNNFRPGNIDPESENVAQRALGVTCAVPRARALFWQGEYQGQTINILRGVVRVVWLLEDGNRQVLAFYWPGDIVPAVDVRAAEAERGATKFVDPSRLKGPILKTFPDGFMPFVGADIKTVFEELKRTISPDVIFTHNSKDAHQDHRLISELTWNTFRDHLILEYEIPKYDGDMGQPGVFIPLSSEV
jgi:hypothetical protein